MLETFSGQDAFKTLKKLSEINPTPLDPCFAPPDLDTGGPRPRFLNVSGLFVCYIPTFLHSYIITLLLCCMIFCDFATLLLARWRGRSFAAQLDNLYEYVPATAPWRIGRARSEAQNVLFIAANSDLT